MFKKFRSTHPLQINYSELLKCIFFSSLHLLLNLLFPNLPYRKLLFELHKYIAIKLYRRLMFSGGELGEYEWIQCKLIRA